MTTLREMLDMLPEEIESWRPDPGEVLVGTLHNAQRASTVYGTVPLLLVQDGEQPDRWCHVWCLHQSLRGEVLKAARRVRVGDEVGFRYHGREKSKSGQEFHRWTFLTRPLKGNEAATVAELLAAQAPISLDEPPPSDDDTGELPF